MKERSLAIGSTLAAFISHRSAAQVRWFLVEPVWGQCWWRRSLLCDPTFLQ